MSDAGEHRSGCEFDTTAAGEDSYSEYADGEETDDEDEDPITPAPNGSTSGTAPAAATAAHQSTENAESVEGPRPPYASASGSGGGSGWRFFQRLFSEEEEIVILKGFLDFTSARGTTYASHQYDTDPFYADMRRRLSHLDFSKGQLIEKLRRLKRKFRTSAARLRSKGESRAFKSPHDRAIHDIARLIWRPASSRTSATDDADFDSPTLSQGSRRTRRRFDALDAAPVSVIPPAAKEPITANASTPGPSESKLPTSAPPATPPAAVGMEEVVKSCLVPVFKELIGYAMKNSSLGGTLLDSIMPPPLTGNGGGSNGRWREQKIREMEVYLKRLELVKELVEAELQRLKRGCGSGNRS